MYTQRLYIFTFLYLASIEKTYIQETYFKRKIHLGKSIQEIFVVPMSMESTGRQVGNLELQISDNLYYFLISFNLQLLLNFSYPSVPVACILHYRINSFYSIYVRITLSLCTAFTLCTPFNPLFLGVFPLYLVYYYLSLSILITDNRILRTLPLYGSLSVHVQHLPFVHFLNPLLHGVSRFLS